MWTIVSEGGHTIITVKAITTFDRFKVRITLQSGSTIMKLESPGFVHCGEWVLLGVTFDNQNISLFLNGKIVNSMASDIPLHFAVLAFNIGGSIPTETFVIRRKRPSSHFFWGLIDEFYAYSRPLSWQQMRRFVSPFTSSSIRNQTLDISEDACNLHSNFRVTSSSPSVIVPSTLSSCLFRVDNVLLSRTVSDVVFEYSIDALFVTGSILFLRHELQLHVSHWCLKAGIANVSVLLPDNTSVFQYQKICPDLMSDARVCFVNSSCTFTTDALNIFGYLIILPGVSLFAIFFVAFTRSKFQAFSFGLRLRNTCLEDATGVTCSWRYICFAFYLLCVSFFFYIILHVLQKPSIHLIKTADGHCDPLTPIPTPFRPLVSKVVQFSVIMPCYLQAQYIEQAIASVLNQSFSNWELIVVDDGSPDNCSSVVRHIQSTSRNRRIRLLRQPNMGLAAARNTGIRFSLGEWIVCLDSDDLLHPRYLSTIANAISQNLDLGLFYANQQFFGESNWRWDIPRYTREKLLYQGLFPVQTAFRYRDWETVGGFNSALPYGDEDWSFWISLARMHSRAWKSDEYLLLYRFKHNSMNRVKESFPESQCYLQTLHHDLYPVLTLLSCHLSLSSHITSETQTRLKTLQCSFPHLHVLYFWIGLYYENKHLWEHALGNYEKSFSLDSKDWQPPFRMSIIYARLSQPQASQNMRAVACARRSDLTGYI